MTERASVVEQAQTDVLGYQAENKGTDLQKSQLQTVLETYFKEVPDLTDMSDTEILNTELETLAKYGTHSITVKEIFNGSFSSESNSKKSVADLREGDKVIYTDGNGNTIPCIVLYDSTSSYGVQIISEDTVGENIELGNGTENSSKSTDSTQFATAKESYNTAIAKLNIAAQSYLNTNLATSARCVGSSPSGTPITNENDTGTYTNTYNYFSSPTDYNNQFKTSDADLISGVIPTDYTQMSKENISCNTIEKKYWVASRWIYAHQYATEIRILRVFEDGTLNADYLCNIVKDPYKSSPEYDSYSYKYGLRPIFILNSENHYIEENETKILIK